MTKQPTKRVTKPRRNVAKVNKCRASGCKCLSKVNPRRCHVLYYERVGPVAVKRKLVHCKHTAILDTSNYPAKVRACIDVNACHIQLGKLAKFHRKRQLVTDRDSREHFIRKKCAGFFGCDFLYGLYVARLGGYRKGQVIMRWRILGSQKFESLDEIVGEDRFYAFQDKGTDGIRVMPHDLQPDDEDYPLLAYVNGQAKAKPFEAIPRVVNCDWTFSNGVVTLRALTDLFFDQELIVAYGGTMGDDIARITAENVKTLKKSGELAVREAAGGYTTKAAKQDEYDKLVEGMKGRMFIYQLLKKSVVNQYFAPGRLLRSSDDVVPFKLPQAAVDAATAYDAALAKWHSLHIKPKSRWHYRSKVTVKQVDEVLALFAARQAEIEDEQNGKWTVSQ